MTCGKCKKRFSFAFNIYTKNYQVYGNVAARNTTTNVRRFLYIVERGRCYYCKQSIQFNKTTVDHMTPLSKRGKNYLQNLVLSCKRCNSTKGNSDYDIFISRWFYLPFDKKKKSYVATCFYKLIGYFWKWISL